MKSNENKPITQEEKEQIIQRAAEKYGEFLTELGFDWKNDIQMAGTPSRVAKMYVNELYAGSYSDEPNITAFDNVDDEVATAYDGMVFQGNITLHSTCAHHAVPFIGKCHIAYIPSPGSKVVGLSKLNRIVDFFARRPQIQEALTMQIHNYLETMLPGNRGIAVVIEAQHLCVKIRGIKHDSTMITNKLSGVFMDVHGAARQEFYDNIKILRSYDSL